MTPDQMQQLRQQHYNATLVELRPCHEELALFRIKPDFPIPPHQPGQYDTLGMGNWEPRVHDSQPEDLSEAEQRNLVRRAYSISCSILDDHGQFLDVVATGWIEFYIVLVRESSKEKPPALTPRLFMLKEGDRLFLGPKSTRHYTAQQVQPDDTVLFFSTGTGEAPHNFMLWDLLRRGHRGRILSACCVRYRRDLGYLRIHEQLMQRYSNYTYLPMTTREAGKGQKVYIQDLLSSGEAEKLLGQTLDPAHTHVFLCGNPKMIGAPELERGTGKKIYPTPPGVVEILEQRGFQMDQSKQPGNIHFEKYW